MLDLLEDKRFALKDLETFLADPTLSPERRTRLLIVARERFLDSPRAAIGIRFNQQEDSLVTIDMVVRGFPSFGVLREGDTIRTIDDEPIQARTDLRSLIISHDPGDHVRMGLTRDGKDITLDVVLGDFSMHDNPGLQRYELLQAWAIRVMRLTGDADPGAVDSPLDPEGWADALEPVGARPRSNSRTNAMSRRAASRLAVGGQIRTPLVSHGADPAWARIRSAQGEEALQGAALEQARRIIAEQQRMRVQRLLDEAIAYRAQIRARIRELTLLLGDQSLSAEQRTLHQKQYDASRTMLRRVDEEIRRLGRDMIGH